MQRNSRAGSGGVLFPVLDVGRHQRPGADGIVLHAADLRSRSDQRQHTDVLALSAVAIGLYLFQGTFDVLRSQILVRIGAQLDRKIAPMAHQVAIDMPRFGFSPAEALERGRDVDTVRRFLGSQGPIALFDLPWMPIFLVFTYMLHPYLGALCLGGAVVLTFLTIVAELRTRHWNSSMQKAVVARNNIADTNARNADVLKAMGFAGRAVSRFSAANDEHLSLQTRTNDISGTFGAISRVLRMLLQSAVLGLGAYLTINGELTAGAIIAASIASARALAPIDLAIGNWKSVVAARAAFDRLKDTVVVLAEAKPRMPLPAPQNSLRIENITVAAPASGRVLLSDVSFELKAGQALGIVGPSGGGKTTLVKALTACGPACADAFASTRPTCRIGRKRRSVVMSATCLRNCACSTPPSKTTSLVLPRRETRRVSFRPAWRQAFMR